VGGRGKSGQLKIETDEKAVGGKKRTGVGIGKKKVQSTFFVGGLCKRTESRRRDAEPGLERTGAETRG